MSASHKQDLANRPIRNRLLVLVVFALLLYIVVPQIESFSESFRLLGNARWGAVGVAAALTAATFVIASCTYHLLALHKLYFWRTLAIQGAGAFANRILPAGLGGLTLNVQYLRKAHYQLPQAIAIAGANNTLGMLGHLLLLSVALLVYHDSVVIDWRQADILSHWYWIAAAAGAVGVVLFAVGGLRRSVLRILGEIGRQFWGYRKHKLRLLAALGCSLVLTLLYVGIYFASGYAVSVELSFAQALVIFSAGMLLGTVTPTPGGLGGVEAGLVAGAVAYGFDADAALAAALLYRLVTYWVPLLPGFILFMTSRRYYTRVGS